MNKNIFLIILLGTLLLSPVISLAAGFVPCGGQGEPACQFCHFFVMLDTILDFIILRMAPTVAVLMLVIGGVMFFFAGTKPEALKTGKDIISSALFGLAIIFAAWIIINTFFGFIGVAEWTGLREGWWSIDCPVAPGSSEGLELNPNQQSTAAEQTASFLGVDPLLEGEEIPSTP
jgi:type IV secretory pathway VirB2 component (pilin)